MLHSSSNSAFEDPVRLMYRSYLRWIRNKLILVAIILVAAWFAGIPHIQWTYTYVGEPRSNVTARAKVSAWYFGVTGWKQIRSGQYGQEGCPFILFVPFRECFGTQTENE